MSENVKFDIFENYRNSDDGFMTDKRCDYCNAQTEQYLIINDTVFLCKSCLSRRIEDMNKKFMEHCITEKRGEI